MEDTRPVGFLASFNAAAVLLAYPLITGIALSLTGGTETTIVTVPVRVGVVLLNVIILLNHYRRKFTINSATVAFGAFWIFAVIRIITDLKFGDTYVPEVHSHRILLYAILLISVPALAIVVSALNIRAALYSNYILRGGCVFLVISFFTSVVGNDPSLRVHGNSALNTISFGLTAFMIAITAIHSIVAERYETNFQLLFKVSMAAFGVYIGVKAGSRGPLLSFFCVLAIWFCVRNLSFQLAIGGLIAISIGLLNVKDQILSILGTFSPVIARRTIEAFNGEDSSALERLESYFWFWNEIQIRPLLGSSFARLRDGMYPGYAHNLILDILLGTGVIGLTIFLIVSMKIMIDWVRTNKDDFNQIFYLHALLYLMSAMTSGAYYSNPPMMLSMTLACVAPYCYGKSRVHPI